MSYAEYIKEGFSHVHRNWQLVLIQFVMGIVHFAGLVVIVVIPVAAGLLMLGFDPAELERLGEVLHSAQGPLELLGRYLGIALMGIVLFLIYLLLAFFLWVFVLGGSAGSLGRSVRETAYKFGMKTFLSEGKRLFFPLLWYSLLVGLMLAGAGLVFAVTGAIAEGALGGLLADGSRLVVFIRVFFTLSYALIGVVVFGGILVLALEGLAGLVLRGTRPLHSLDNAVKSLGRDMRALRFLGTVISLYMGAQFVIFLTGYSLQRVPLAGPLLSLPYQLLSSLLEGYLCLGMLAAVFAFSLPPKFLPGPGQPGHASDPFGQTEGPPVSEPISEGSTRHSDTSPEGAPPHGPAPEE